MSMESELVLVLKAVCPRVFSDVAPHGAAEPYLVWQCDGGETLRFLDNTPGSQRNSSVLVSVYSLTRKEALALIREAEDALCASTPLTVDPDGEPVTTYEDDTRRYGAIQRFSIWADR